MKTTLLISIASALHSFGVLLSSQDSDRVGRDDLIGEMLVASGDAMLAFATNNERGLRRAVVAIRAACDAILGAGVPSTTGGALLGGGA